MAVGHSLTAMKSDLAHQMERKSLILTLSKINSVIIFLLGKNVLKISLIMYSCHNLSMSGRVTLHT